VLRDRVSATRRLLRGRAGTAAATRGIATRRSSTTAVLRHRIVAHDDAATRAHVALLAERLQKPQTELLASHLHETERGDLRNLVLRAVTAQALHEAAQHEVTVRLEHHVDEVDHDNPADVAQPQ